MTVKDLKTILEDLDEDIEIKLTDRIILDKMFSCHGCKHESKSVTDDPCPRCKRLKIDYYERGEADVSSGTADLD